MLALLGSIGVNFTTFIHFGIFLVVFVFLYKVISSYFVYTKERLDEQGFVGSQLDLDKAKKLEQEYSENARKLNGKIDELFQAKQEVAKKEASKLSKEFEASLQKKAAAWSQSIDADKKNVHQEVEGSLKELSSAFISKLRKGN